MPLYMEFPSWIRPEIIPGFPIRWYAIMYLVAFAVAYVLFTVQVKQRKLAVDQDTIVNLFFFAILGLLLGARIFAVLVYDPTGRYLREPWLIFWPFQDGRFVGLQGMSYHGGLIGAAAGIIIYTRVKKIDFLDWGDMLVHGIPLGYTFGRIGNFINGELYGKVATGPWGMIFPTARPVSASLDWVRQAADRAGFTIPAGADFVNLPRHPSQLYEAVLEGILLWLVMWFIVRPHRPFKGFSIAVYLIGYGIARFFAEYTREPDIELGYIFSLTGQNNPTEIFSSLGDISMGQILCVLMILAGILLLFIFRRQHRLRPAFEKAETVPPKKPRKKKK